MAVGACCCGMISFGRLRLVLCAGLLSAVLAAAGCDSLFATPVRKILDNPREYHGKTVTIRGEVKEVVGLLVIRYFIIDDGTAAIPVITHKPLPAKGSKQTVKGTVTEAVALGERQYLVIMEDEGKR